MASDSQTKPGVRLLGGTCVEPLRAVCRWLQAESVPEKPTSAVIRLRELTAPI